MTLEDWLKQDRSLPDQLKVIEGLCAALNRAHQRREVHRSLEPGHVEVASDGSCDLSAALSGPPSHRYRAPEVAEGGPPSPEADIYSAGVILYEVLAGRSPSGERPTPLSDLRQDVSRDLTDAIMGCLERGPDWRPKDLSYLLQVVATMRGAGARAGGRAAGRAAEPARPAAGRAGSRRAARGPASKSNVPLYALVVLVAAGASAGLWWYFDERGGSGVALVPPASVQAAPTVAPTPAPTPTAGPVAPTTRPSAPPQRPGSTPTVVAPPTPPPVTQPRATPTPEPVRAVTATPPPATPPPPTPPPATPAPATPTPALATPTPAPVATPPPVAAPPAVLTAVSPLTVKRGITTLLDVRGTGLRSDHQARIVRVKEAVTGVSVVRQKWVDPTLIKVLVNIEAGAIPGAYAVALVDGRGAQTNGLNFTVSK